MLINMDYNSRNFEAPCRERESLNNVLVKTNNIFILNINFLFDIKPETS